ncbi:hypothetical protein M378DRAFT_382520 [Amanita muscaria Koide BX008]|uniref:Uncharacterized protein n=1 Tax=Amanita muscaria (strain Koide BX008) TaxID=946122 RepID=A0A0C2WMN4_AMAMK|nr:hypothetical protein M378DRAFT_382520 [Amanita muscaria Koide BX008]
MKVRSIADAQNLIDLIFCLNKKKCFESWFGAAAHNATRLALAIYGRIPLLPRSLFLDSADLDQKKCTYQRKVVTIWYHERSVWRDCFDAFMWGNLSHASMVPCLGICFQSHIVVVSQSPENEMLNKWRQSSIPSVSQIQPIFFEVAKDYVYLDSDNHVKVQFFSFCPNDMCKGQFDYDGFGRSSTLEDNIHQLGRLFYRVNVGSCFRLF